MEVKGLVPGIEHRNPQNIRGQQIRSELDTFEFGIDGSGQGFGQSCFSRARIVLEKNVAATGERGQKLSDGIRLPTDNASDVGGYSFVNIHGSVNADARFFGFHGTRNHLLCDTVNKRKAVAVSSPMI